MKALGMIEVYGKLAAVEALDSALKAANVKLVNVSRVGGGLVTIMVTGDVGATKAAVEAGKAAAEQVGRIVSVHIIPRPSEDVGHMLTKEEIVSDKLINSSNQVESDFEETIENEVEQDDKPVCEIMLEEDSAKAENVKEFDIKEENENIIATVEESFQDDEYTDLEERQISKETISKESMQTMTVANLRSLARQLEITNMTRKEIRFANKEDLIRSICEFLEQE